MSETFCDVLTFNNKQDKSDGLVRERISLLYHNTSVTGTSLFHVPQDQKAIEVHL